MVAHALADAQVEDRRVVDRVGVERRGRRGRTPGRGPSPAARARRARAASRGERAAGARVEVGGAERVAQQRLEEEALLVGRLAAGERGGARARAAERGGRGVERDVPA